MWLPLYSLFVCGAVHIHMFIYVHVCLWVCTQVWVYVWMPEVEAGYFPLISVFWGKVYNSTWSWKFGCELQKTACLCLSSTKILGITPHLFFFFHECLPFKFVCSCIYGRRLSAWTIFPNPILTTFNQNVCGYGCLNYCLVEEMKILTSGYYKFFLH